MRRRFAHLLAADTTWLEVMLALFTLLWGLALQGTAAYAASPVFAPLARFIPHSVAASTPVLLAALLGVGLWLKLDTPPKGLAFRFAVTTISLFFWLLLAVLFARGATSPLSAIFYGVLVLVQVFLFYRLWLEWLAEQEARLHGPGPDEQR